jgi:N-acetylglucosamine transport system substrate-binding protein
MNMVLNGMIYHQGGIDAIHRLDNLEPNAWKQDAVKNAVEAVYMLAAKDYIMPGSAGLTHTEAQAEWLKGKAVFIPCGSWLENEEKGLVPDGFNMVVRPVPALGGDRVAFDGIQASAGETFIVPAKGKNAQGGKEYLRMLFSRQGSRFFAQNTRSLTVVQGSADGLDLGTAFKSTQDAVTAAGANTFTVRYDGWYRPLMEAARDQMGALMTKQIRPDDFMNNVQKVADQVAKDDSIKKYKA